MTYQYGFRDYAERAARITWRADELDGEAREVDFARPFLPETLARTGSMTFLSPGEQLALNQIRGHAYVAFLEIAEGVAEAFVDGAVRDVRPLRRFRDLFAAGFGANCETAGPAQTIRDHILSRDPLAVALFVMHLDRTVQRHALNSVEGDMRIDPAVRRLLLVHGKDAGPGAGLVEDIAKGMAPSDIDEGVDGYLSLIGFLDDQLKTQTRFDLDALEQAVGRRLSGSDWTGFIDAQLRANRWTFIGAGLAHARVIETFERLSPKRRALIEAMAPIFS